GAGERASQGVPHPRQTGALVAPGLARAPERRDAAVAVGDVLEALRRIRHGPAVAVDDPARRKRLVIELVDAYLAGRHGRRGHVELERRGAAGPAPRPPRGWGPGPAPPPGAGPRPPPPGRRGPPRAAPAAPGAAGQTP